MAPPGWRVGQNEVLTVCCLEGGVRIYLIQNFIFYHFTLLIMPEDIITKQKLDKYFDVTGRALAKVKIVDNPDIKDSVKKAEDYLDMAKRYYSDARHFMEKGDFVNSFACLNYAHGWLDAGARIKLFDVGGDNVLFTVD